jgi:hypothetical protein
MGSIKYQGIPLPSWPVALEENSVMQCVLVSALFTFLMAAPLTFAQQPSTTDCSFDDGKQISIRYDEVSAKHSLKNGQPWAPDNKPMTLFTQTTLTIGNASIPVGAYTVYLIPGSEAWTLVLNKNVQEGAKYDQKQDLARVQMPAAELGKPVDHLKLTLAKMGGSQCNLRVYYGKTGTYGAEFKEQSTGTAGGS